MKQTMTVAVWTVRILAVLLFLTSLRFAWAGAWIYQGERAFRKGDYAMTFHALEKAEQIDRENPRLWELRGESLFQEGTKTKDTVLLDKAAESFGQLSRNGLPGYARSRVWQALSLVSRSGGVDAREWTVLKQKLIEAVQMEPGSSWIAYQTGVLYLGNKKYLNPDEEKWALDQMQRAIAFHNADASSVYLPQASPFLAPALSLLWNAFHDFELLKRVTPDDFASLRELLAFMDEKKLWRFRENIHNRFLMLSERLYARECEKAETWFEEKKYRKSQAAFRKAFWARSWAFTRAKAGILASEDKQGQTKDGIHGLFHKDTREVLKEILSDPDQRITGSVLSALGGIVAKKDDAELKKLYETYRFKNGSDLPGPESFMARTLEPVLQTGEWWKRENRWNLQVHLKPGPGRLQVTFKGIPGAGGEGAYLLFRLNERELKGVYIPPYQWRKIEIPVETSGGLRWFTAEILNSGKTGEGPGVVAGPVKVFSALPAGR